MKHTGFLFCFLVILLTLSACKSSHAQDQLEEHTLSSKELLTDYQKSLIKPSGKNIEDRFLVPEGYQRVDVQPGSFQAYLRNLPLKADGAEVHYFNGDIKYNNKIYAAVVDLDIGKKDLHQCADAIMRLRAEYLWNKRAYDAIHFHFTNGMDVTYSEWMKGRRIVVNGNESHWVNKKQASNTYQDFWEYLEIIFAYAGTISLYKELEEASLNDLQIGDVFIHPGSPGHAVIVVDVAFNKQINKKIFMVAQSYMPAQEIQVLMNNSHDYSPWYPDNFGKQLRTPEWAFHKNSIYRFKE